MNFADNLRAVRKEKNLSQEDLAELLEVSRQAVSKWEQGMGYPETEKLLLLAQALCISLDELMGLAPQSAAPAPQRVPVTGKVMIRSQDGRSLVNCEKVRYAPVSKRPDEPNFALFGIDCVTFMGDNSTLLGWYADEDSVRREVDAILDALQNGTPAYQLQYAANVKQTLLSVKLVP